MTTFDYEKAWQDLALPAYKQLSTAVLCLVEETGIVSDNLRQDNKCQMVWPDDGGKLREMFNRLDSETLADAARVVYYYGHWRPEASIAGNAPVIAGGGSWKFTNYADQVLRNRFNIGLDVKNGVGLLIHECTIRIAYSSSETWTWHEVAPATESGIAKAAKLADGIRRRVAVQKNRKDRDNAAHKAMQELKFIVAWPGWNTSAYTVEDSVLEMRRAERMPKPDKAKLIAETQADFDNSVAKLSAERDGKVWLIENDLPTGNAIYYSHTGKWCFGWRNPIAAEARTELLARLAKFPFPYDVK